MRPLLKQIAELIGGAVRDLAVAFDSRIKALESAVASLGESRQEIESAKAATARSLDQVLKIELDAAEFTEKLQESAGEIQSRLQTLIDSANKQFDERVKSFNDATGARDSAYNQRLGELTALIQDRLKQPSLEEIVGKCLAKLQSSQPAAQAPDVSKFLTEEQVQGLVASATKELQPRIDVADLVKQLVALLPTEESLAARAASIVNVPDVSGLITEQRAKELLAETTKDLQPALDVALLANQVAELLPSSSELAQAAAALVQIPEAPSVEGLVSEVRAAELISEATKLLQPRLEHEQIMRQLEGQFPSKEELRGLSDSLTDAIASIPSVASLCSEEDVHALIESRIKAQAIDVADIVRQVVAHFPSEESVAGKVAGMIELPAEPDLSAFMTEKQVGDLIAAAREGRKEDLADLMNALRSMQPAPLDLAQVAKAAAELVPVPKDGKSVTLEEVEALVTKALTLVGPPTAEQVAQALEPHVARWALDFERRAQDQFQRASERIPLPKDGVDGLGFDDLTVEYDDDRTFKFVMVREGKRKEFAFKIGMMIYRGIFDEALTYSKGDVATWGGSAWISLKDVPQGKPGHSQDWQLVVKKGRDGKQS